MRASRSKNKKNRKSRAVSVAIIMGSRSDRPKMKSAEKVLKSLGIRFHVQIVSAHRTPHHMFKFAETAKDLGYQIIIAGAGGAAHLPGMVASLTMLPVIGVPVSNGSMKGLDALLSIAQMPKGVPVACMAVDNSHNAALLAARIIAEFSHSPELSDRLKDLREKTRRKVMRRSKLTSL